MQPKACNKIHQEQHNTREASSDFVVAKTLFPTSSLKLTCIWTVQSIPPPNQCLNKMGQNSGPTRSQQANEYWALHNHTNQTIKQSICSSTSPTAQQTDKHTHTHTHSRRQASVYFPFTVCISKIHHVSCLPLRAKTAGAEEATWVLF